MIAALLGGIVGSPWMRAALRHGAMALAMLLVLLSLRRSGERAGRLAERLETTEKANDVQRRMLEAAAGRPRDRDELAERLVLNGSTEIKGGKGENSATHVSLATTLTLQTLAPLDPATPSSCRGTSVPPTATSPPTTPRSGVARSGNS